MYIKTMKCDWSVLTPTEIWAKLGSPVGQRGSWSAADCSVSSIWVTSTGVIYHGVWWCWLQSQM